MELERNSKSIWVRMRGRLHIVTNLEVFNIIFLEESTMYLAIIFIPSII